MAALLSPRAKAFLLAIMAVTASFLFGVGEAWTQPPPPCGTGCKVITFWQVNGQPMWGAFQPAAAPMTSTTAVPMIASNAGVGGTFVPNVGVYDRCNIPWGTPICGPIPPLITTWELLVTPQQVGTVPGTQAANAIQNTCQ